MSGRDVVSEALDALMAGDPAVLAGFGLERLTASSPLWEERLTLDGAGRAELRTRRSIADVGGEAIGAFAHDAGPAAVRAVVQQLQRVRLFRLTPGHVEPFGVRVVLSVVAGGAAREVVLGADPAVLAPVQPLLQELDRLAAAVRSHPSMTLELELAAGGVPSVGETDLPLVLRLKNAGDIGFWMAEPSSLPLDVGVESADDEDEDEDEDGGDEEGDEGDKDEDGDEGDEDGDEDEEDEDEDPGPVWRNEYFAVWYGVREPVRPDVTPLPLETRRARLVAAMTDAPPLLWVPGRSTVERHFRATIRVRRPGELLLRAGWSSYAGADSVGGRPRLRGCAFARDVALVVR